MQRRDWLRGATVLGGAGLCALASRAAERDSKPGGEHAFTLAVDANDPGKPVQRGLLGQNLQWVDGGDGLVDRNGAWQPELLAKAVALRPSGLRYPGGAQSDTYHWAAGVGATASRGSNLHFHRRQPQPTLLGTLEFLELCEACDAEPLITVNVVTGTADEAAAWVRATNVTGFVSRRTGRRLARVPCWEIGNEPYLQEGDRSLWMSPTEYVARARAFIRAMRAVDPTLRIGLPLRTATIGGVAATPYPGFAAEVLSGVTEPVDFLGLHNAYMPYLFDRVPDDDTLYRGLMGAAATVERNLADTRALVAQRRPQAPLAFGITEYNALFTLGKGRTDDLVTSPAGALYVADLLCMLARQDDVTKAHYWSLSGNWNFGAIASSGVERPGYAVLRLFDEALQGRRLGFTLEAQRFDAPRAGVAAPVQGLPLVTAMVTREPRRLRIVLLNKDRHRRATGRLAVPGAANAGRADQVELAAIDPMSPTEKMSGWRRRESAVARDAEGGWQVSLPPASLSLVSLAL